MKFKHGGEDSGVCVISHVTYNYVGTGNEQGQVIWESFT